MRLHELLVIYGAALLVSPLASADEDGNVPISLTLNDTFIEQYKNRATITDIPFLVDHAHDRANPASKDGDLHVAGRSSAVGLPLVAELMNAKSEKGLVRLFNDSEGSVDPLTISGVWRIWPEHGGVSPQVQGQKVKPAESTNPEHLFEIHPITRVGDDDVLDTLHHISGFEYKEAESSFQRYESIAFRLACDGPTTTMRTKMIGYNYVDFEIELLEGPDQHVVEDGLSVFANIRDPEEGELLVYKRRIWFVKGSAPYKAVTKLKSGERLRIVGIPRVNLSLVAWRCSPASQPDALEWNLPYEMVAVGLR